MQELTKAQEEYFKYSQLRDREGNLKICYHYTNNDFDKFDKEYIGKNGDDGYFGKGFYFTSMDRFGKGFGQKCLEVYLDIKNPLIIDELESYQKEDLLMYMQENHPDYGTDYGPTKIELEPDFDTGFYSEDLLNIELLTNDKLHYGHWVDYANEISDWAQLNGFDAILSERNNNGSIREIVVFEPNQIKSVDNLYPTYDDNFKDNSKDYFKEASLDEKIAAAEIKAASQTITDNKDTINKENLEM